MTNPFKWSFDNVVPAYALFFKNENTHGIQQRALRLEVPEIAMEFTDGAYIGKDPEGFQYYNKEADFEKDSGTSHTYHVSESSTGGKTYAVIEFRHFANSTPYAKFYSPDNHRVATAADMGNHTSTGSWVTLKSASCYTTIKKSSNSRTVTMTLTSVDKVATWDAGSTNFSPSSFEVNGYLHYKRLGKLKDAIYANYNNDRVVFYENDWSGKDFVGFFIPLEDAKETLGITSTRSTPAATFTNVKWVDT
ncbi:hypothetical protein DFH08DRAFT_902858 [Mycena albidolilacea]|uniref:Uncharacterized protein n=1 Tax=Mycena albidolilacea TaxID=1033008 RepID=A0AAD6Z309_9AGAR|nr:hypothetical protein DFH08DRAFT_902858 [Mycena albidolilacea]